MSAGSNSLILIISMLLSVAFFTLMERKYISLSQARKGPNKTSFTGILQPISDAVKLISKESNLNSKSNFAMFIASPGANLACSMTMWAIFPFQFEFGFMKMSTLFILSCMAMNLLSLLAMSWSSNSNYAFIGMMRTISQLISYEINLMMIIITMINMSNQMSFKAMWMIQLYLPLMLTLSQLFMLWLMTILAETNRTPFDFSEGESELISGYNIEYGSSSFVFLFLSEYSSILMMSMISALMFSGSRPTSPQFYLIYFSICFFFIWARTTFPRFRYDKLMKLNWTQILPISTFILMWSFTFKMYCTIKN